MKPKMLLIDDDDIAREHLASILRDAAYEVFELPSPIGATRTILTERIDVVILDVFMPQLDGDKFAKLLKDNPKLSRVAIVLVSSCEPGELGEIAIRVKADAVVSKGDARTKLADVVARVHATVKNRSRTG